MSRGSYLLDTSTVIWTLADPSRVSAAARKATSRALRAQRRLLLGSRH